MARGVTSSVPFCGSPASEEATETCQRFRHQVRIAAKDATNFLFCKIYKLTVPWFPAVSKDQSCTETMKTYKDFLSFFLILNLSGKNPFPLLSTSDSLALSAALASVTKSFPDACPCMSEGLFEELKSRLTNETPKLPEGYLAFVRKEVREMFPKGIKQKSIENRFSLTVPPLKSTTCHSRADGGSYAYWEGRREEFLETMQMPKILHRPQFMVAPDPGKPRPLVKNYPSYLTLRPLHSAIYDRLSTLPWLLRGPPSRERILRAGFQPKSKYFSADFSAASDNLPIEVAEAIIDELAFLSPSSLSPLFSEARKSLRPTIDVLDDKDLSYEVTRGQLMGNLLSFPLLCIQNYLGTRWVDNLTGESPSRLINGDDLVVQASEQWVSAYREVCPSLGFSLNVKKTAYTESFLTINSTYYSRQLTEIPFLRMGSFREQDPRKVGDAITAISRSFGPRHSKRRVVIRRLLERFDWLIRLGRRSAWKLGVRLRPHDRLPHSLWTREKRRVCPEVPVPAAPRGFHQGMSVVEDKELSDLVEGREIATVVVETTWRMGKYERPEKERRKDVLAKLRENPTRRYKERAMEARVRLIAEKKEKNRALPTALLDCLYGTHDVAHLDKDGFMVWGECDLCSKVWDRKRALKQKKDSDALAEGDARLLRAFEASKSLGQVVLPSLSGGLTRAPDFVWTREGEWDWDPSRTAANSMVVSDARAPE
nr:MAG: RNA-dependent RNA polymerase [Botourmiaviridae sp.]